MNELFQITETKPTKLQSARRALADAEKELAASIENGNHDTQDCQRAVDRLTALVAEEERAELKKIQNP
jgi:hypothetical protein